jgi:hypothetical protein
MDDMNTTTLEIAGGATAQLAPGADTAFIRDDGGERTVSVEWLYQESKSPIAVINLSGRSKGEVAAAILKTLM